MERNFETVMIEQCSPVLAGLKAAGLFRYETQDRKDLAERVRGWNARLSEKGLRVRVLKGCARTHRYLVYVYRENRLREVLLDEDVRAFLVQEGYRLPEGADDCEPLLRQLSRRLCCEAEFPHEIGVFLGYPLMSRGNNESLNSASLLDCCVFCCMAWYIGATIFSNLYKVFASGIESSIAFSMSVVILGTAEPALREARSLLFTK